jgi:hypothetical protein
MLVLFQSVSISGSISNIYCHGSKYSLPSLFRIDIVHHIVSSLSHALWVY